MKTGTKVIAILNAKDGVVNSFGEGTYAGDFVPPPEVQPLRYGLKNPRIDLDNGKTVWGRECWWGEAEATREKFKDYKWNEVDIDEVRKGDL